MSKAYALAQPREGRWTWEDLVADVRRALVVVAHPDDVDHGCAGTVARLTDAGVAVHQVIMTRGGAGGHDPDEDPAELMATRDAESRAAAAVLGATVELLDHPDGMVLDTPVLRRDVARAIRSHRPDLVLTTTPAPLVGGTFINHPDHRVVGQLTLDNVVTGGPTALVFPELLAEGLLPHKPRRVALFGPIGGGALALTVDGDTAANCCIDIGSTYERKHAALAAHASQVTDRDLADFLRWTAESAARGQEFRFGECLHVLDAFP